MKDKYILAGMVVGLVLSWAAMVFFAPSIVDYKLTKYKSVCLNDSIPAYNRIISSRLTMLEAREDSAYMVSTGSIAEYSIWTQRRGGYATRYLLKESFKTSHREPTLAGFEEWLKK